MQLDSRLSTKDHFELFGLTPGFDIDTGQLASAYRELQQQTHPDRFVNEGESLRRMALQLNSQVNEAYTTLKSPLSRGRYLLQLRGLLMDESDTRMETPFLMQQMALREALENSGQSEDPLATIDSIRQQLEADTNALQQSLRSQLAQQSPQGDSEAWQSLRKLQFLVKFAQELDEAEQRLSD
ncbi:Fe-S protein assembly co-chaperone HscB [Ectothiorhodospiraceae bacterium BW-2]|nr:Fe-S protein assembly co-chaperone HscB [Ectothiorhodospiraceae bacterium BW-2]